jgi:hypothetical protein
LEINLDFWTSKVEISEASKVQSLIDENKAWWAPGERGQIAEVTLHSKYLTGKSKFPLRFGEKSIG